MKIEFFTKSLSVKEMAYQNIKYQIVSGKIKPGVWLKEGKLATTMNISRPPIREALNLLERERFVTMIPRKGAIVSNITTREIEDIYQLRDILESFLINKYFNKISKERIKKIKNEFMEMLELKELNENYRMRYLNLSKEFHEIINESCMNEKIINILKNNLEIIHWFRAFSKLRESFRDSILENLSIIESIKNGDKKLTIKNMKEHSAKAKKSLIRDINPMLKKNNDKDLKFPKSKML